MQHGLGNHKVHIICSSLHFHGYSSPAILSQACALWGEPVFCDLLRLYLVRLSSHFERIPRYCKRGKKPKPTLTYEQSIWKSGNSALRFHQHLFTSVCPVLRKAQPWFPVFHMSTFLTETICPHNSSLLATSIKITDYIKSHLPRNPPRRSQLHYLALSATCKSNPSPRFASCQVRVSINV